MNLDTFTELKDLYVDWQIEHMTSQDKNDLIKELLTKELVSMSPKQVEKKIYDDEDEYLHNDFLEFIRLNNEGQYEDAYNYYQEMHYDRETPEVF